MTSPSDEEIMRAIDRLGRAFRARDLIARYLKAGRPLEAETTSTLHEQWAQHRQVPVTAENQWTILSLEIELALRGDAVDGLFRNTEPLPMATLAAMMHYSWGTHHVLRWPLPVDNSDNKIVAFKGKPVSRSDDDDGEEPPAA